MVKNACDFLIATAVFIGLVSVDIKLALIMAASVPFAILFLGLTIKRSKTIENKNNSALDMVSLFVEYVRGIPVLKSFSNNKSLDSELTARTKFGETSKAASRFKAKTIICIRIFT